MNNPTTKTLIAKAETTTFLDKSNSYAKSFWIVNNRNLIPARSGD